MSAFNANILRPVWPYQVNHLSGQARGLEYWLPMPHQGGNKTTAVCCLPPVENLATLAGTDHWAPSPFGNAIRLTAGIDSYVLLGNTADIIRDGTSASFSFWYRKTDATLRVANAVESNTSFGRIVIHLPYSDGNIYWDWNDTTTGRLSTAITVTTLWEHWAFTVGPNWMAIYRNGLRIADKSASSTLTPGSEFHLGGTPVLPSDNAEIADFRYYSRMLSDADVVAIYDPQTRYDLYWMPWLQTVYAPPVVAGYTLTASAGSFALSGQAATLKVGRTVPATVGSFALSGQAATLKATRTLTSSVGAFALAGQDAAIKAARLLTSAAGAYSLSGQAAAFRLGYGLAAGVGTYALTGQDATLRAPIKIIAEAGAFTLTGMDANLTTETEIVPISRDVRILRPYIQ